ncbi:DUF4358 domain-containing protein [Brevibacillus massiliensis]|uniref:DUF4358 domain-containing protein n=1 Tax=Brevibacillus massiliensis TaxID=1118054 RepID=UPI0021C42870|nr:DUF4358 domain-containing protein [Brevibacillus massiliensis]
MAFIAFALMSAAVAGCSGKAEEAGNATVTEVGEKISQAVHLDELKRGDRDKLQKLYHISADEVEDFILYLAPTNVKADEVLVVKVKDANQVEEIIESILNRVDAQAKKFKDYLPDEYAFIEHHVVKTNGNFILFAVSPEADQIETAFVEALK